MLRLRLLISAASPAISPHPEFAVEDYLLGTCGLTRAQALKASAKLSHLKSSYKPDAVLSFLAGLGFSSTDVAPLVARDPEFLRAKVDKTLVPNAAELTGLGLSRPEIARFGLSVLWNKRFRFRSTVSKLQYYLPLFGSCENLFRALKRGSYLLSANLEQVVMPNVAFLREYGGLCDCDIAKLCLNIRRILTTRPERVQEMVARAEALGVSRGSGMFKEALQAVAFRSKEKITAKVDYLKKTFRWSDDDVSIALTKAPSLLRKSEDILRRKSAFLISKAGLEPAYVAHRPVIVTLSLEGRLRPRHHVLKFLKENGFLDRDRCFATVVRLTDAAFVEKYICPHKEVAPHLAEDYAAACRGEVLANFRFA